MLLGRKAVRTERLLRQVNELQSRLARLETSTGTELATLKEARNIERADADRAKAELANRSAELSQARRDLAAANEANALRGDTGDVDARLKAELDQAKKDKMSADAALAAEKARSKEILSGAQAVAEREKGNQGEAPALVSLRSPSYRNTQPTSSRRRSSGRASWRSAWPPPRPRSAVSAVC